MFFTRTEQIYHHIPGRIRVFVPEIYRNRTLGDSLEEYLAGVSELKIVHCNSYTGKVLITYDEKRISQEQVFDSLHAFQRKQLEERRPLRQERIDEPEDLPLVYQGYRLAGLSLIVLGILSRRIIRKGSPVSPPWLFYLSASSIIVSSYPFIKSGLQKMPFLKRPGHDFWLGFAGCSFLILRQDLLGLLVLLFGYLNAFVQARTLHHSKLEIERILNEINVTKPEKLPIEDDAKIAFQKGQQIHIGGTIMRGTAILDESNVTGSPLPVIKYPGEKALGGSWVLAGEVEIDLDPLTDEQNRSGLQLAPVLPSEIYGVANYTRQISRVAFMAALGVFLWSRNPDRSLAVLLACSPSAASISATAAYNFGLARLLKEGVLIKDDQGDGSCG